MISRYQSNLYQSPYTYNSLCFGCINRRFKHNQNDPYRHWHQDGSWHALSIVTHATAWRREFLLYTSRRQGQAQQFCAKNPRSHVIVHDGVYERYKCLKSNPVLRSLNTYLTMYVYIMLHNSYTNLGTNLTMHQSHIQQCTICKRNAHIFLIQNYALCDICLIHCVLRKMTLF